MSFATVVRKYPVRSAVICFALGAVTALLGVAVVATVWTAKRFVEQRTEQPADAPRVDLVVMQKGKPQGLDSEFREYFVAETRKLPGVEAVSEGVVGTANIYRDRAKDIVDDTLLLVQGW